MYRRRAFKRRRAPRGGRRRRPTGRRPIKRRRSSRRSVTRVGGVLAADTLFVKLRYHDAVNLVDNTGGAPQISYWSGNGMYDPRVAALGHQPTGFDQYMQWYQRYIVLGSAIKVEFWDTSDEANTRFPVEVGVIANNSASPVNFGTMFPEENTRNTTKTIGPHDGGHGKAIIKRYQSTPRILGVSKNHIMSDTNFSGTSSTQPGNEWYWGVYANDATIFGNKLFDINAMITITYYVMFRSRVAPMTTS